MINAHYLTTSDNGDKLELEARIKKLEQVLVFSCPPVPNPYSMFPSDVIVKKGKAGDYDSCDICPFPGCELSVVELQKENIPKTTLIAADKERIELAYDSNIYTIYFKNHLRD